MRVGIGSSDKLEVQDWGRGRGMSSHCRVPTESINPGSLSLRGRESNGRDRGEVEASRV